MRMLYDVGVFHLEKRLKIGPAKPTLLPPAEMMMRILRMHEELAEIQKAHMEGDLVKVADGLADLVYFALGTSIKLSLPFPAIWDAVHRANMKKVAVPEGEGKYKMGEDVIKPTGWIGPEHEIQELLRKAGWPR